MFQEEYDAMTPAQRKADDARRKHNRSLKVYTVQVVGLLGIPKYGPTPCTVTLPGIRAKSARAAKELALENVRPLFILARWAKKVKSTATIDVFNPARVFKPETPHGLMKHRSSRRGIATTAAAVGASLPEQRRAPVILFGKARGHD